MRTALALGCGLLVLIVGAAVAGFLVFRGNSGGSSSPLTADPTLQAFVRPRLSVVEALGASVVATCPAHRTGNAPSPALGTPIAAWSETRGVAVECMFESVPGSGSATGGGFEEYGDTSIPDGSWAEYGPSGWHLDACRGRHDEPCTDYAYSMTDPGVVWIESTQPFPGGGGWAHVRVVMRR